MKEKFEYRPEDIEQKWQQRWDSAGIFHAEPVSEKPCFYLLEMFPYPSGRIHMGHVRNYSIGDAYARFLMMKGYNVLHPMGWDAFGLPAENAAIAHGEHPRVWTERNIEYMREQLKSLGYSYDWRREFATCDPEYYRWEQEFFIKMMEKDLVYRKESLVNFCPDCNTVLANEQVEGGCCWRCGTEVEFRRLPGWFMRITRYADELLESMEELREGWPERVLTMQEHWIGKSEGLEAEFPVADSDLKIRFFTTRPDTIFGVTFMAMALEHPLVEEVSRVGGKEKEVQRFVSESLRKRVSGEMDEALEKEGVFTGAYCINPLTGERVPIYVANFVLMEYGTGAIMCVPAHDQRDFEFARRYRIPIRLVIQRKSEPLREDKLEEAWEGGGYLVNSGRFSGMESEAAKDAIIRYCEENNMGKRAVNYRLKDWGISRQRYWGAPIPVIYCDDCGTVPVPLEQLPVKLPDNVEITGKGRSPLAAHPEFVNTTCPRCGRAARRETDTMDTFVESSWYFLRFASLNNENRPFDTDEVHRWMPVDQYIGGIEHAVLHLLYARFFTKVLRDLGYINVSEPFKRLLTQGMVIKDGAKMSKSRGNVVDPDDIIKRYGADTARVFILFAAPPERDLEWSEAGVEGVYRFLQRVWRVVNVLNDRVLGSINLEEGEAGKEFVNLRRTVHKTIKEVTEEFLTRLHFNKALSHLMVLLNELNRIAETQKITTTGDREAVHEAVECFLKMLAPFAPHIAEELWERTGGKGFVSIAEWPVYNESLIKEEVIKIPVQVNGKLRGEVEIPVNAGKDEAFEMARTVPRVQRHLDGKEIVKVIFVPGKILNIIVKSQ